MTHIDCNITNTCYALNKFCETKFNNLYEICNCINNTNIYDSNCFHFDIDINVFIYIIILTFGGIFLFAFFRFCYFKIYILNRNRNRIERSQISQTLPIYQENSTDNLPSYEELSIHNEIHIEAPPPYENNSNS